MKRIILLTLFFFIASNFIDAQIPQPRTKLRTKINGQFVHDSLVPKKEIPVVPDTIPADRDMEFNLEKLSYMASMVAFSMPNFDRNGLCVLELDFDTNGVNGLNIIRDETIDGLGIPARAGFRKYMNKYKPKPAIRDGKPIETKGLLLPIIIDQSIFQQK